MTKKTHITEAERKSMRKYDIVLDLQVCVARMKDIFIIGNKGSCHVILSLSLLELSELSY